MDFKDRYQKLQGQLKETVLGEDRIIAAYRREKPSHLETIVWYSNDTLSSFNIEGELGMDSIPDKKNAVKVDMGTAATSIGDNAFYNCSGLMTIMIPDSMTSIGKSAFEKCSGLTAVTIPDSVTSIGDWVFSNCAALSSITSLRTLAPTVADHTFGTLNPGYTGRNTYSSGNNILKVPQGATGYDSSYWLDPLQNATKCGFHIEYLD